MAHTHTLGPGGTKDFTLRYPGPHYANYRGDQRHIIGELKGPGLDGRVWVATDAAYDPDTDRTRVEFDRYVPKAA